MIAKVKVPKLTENVDEVTITGWLKKEGDTVGKGDPLVEMTTSKAVFEVESPRAGVVRKILAKEKSVLPTGYVVALIGAAADPLPDVTDSNAALLKKHTIPHLPQPITHSPLTINHQPSSSVRATPAARRLAKEKGIDLAKLKEKINAEVITEEMVRQYAG